MNIKNQKNNLIKWYDNIAEKYDSPDKNYKQESKSIDKILQMFDNDISVCSIAKKIGFDNNSVIKILRRYDRDTSIRDRNKNKNRPLLKDLTDQILLLHYSGYTQDEIAKEIGCASSHICRILQQYGVEDDYKCKYTVDETFFKTIDTQDKAYILGWWYSDGNVMPDGKIRVQLAEEDVCILNYIKDQIQYTGPRLLLLAPPT